MGYNLNIFRIKTLSKSKIKYEWREKLEGFFNELPLKFKLQYLVGGYSQELLTMRRKLYPPYNTLPLKNFIKEYEAYLISVPPIFPQGSFHDNTCHSFICRGMEFGRGWITLLELKEGIWGTSGDAKKRLDYLSTLFPLEYQKNNEITQEMKKTYYFVEPEITLRKQLECLVVLKEICFQQDIPADSVVIRYQHC